jgi:hypothetical protein
METRRQVARRLHPAKKVGNHPFPGEISELEVWQERLSALLERKVSIGVRRLVS